MRIFLGIILLLIVGAGAYALVSYNSGREFPAPEGMVEEDLGKTFESDTYSFAISYPSDMTATSSFTRSYFALPSWSLLSQGEGAVGDPVVALILPNSNEVTAGELRIGVSSDLDELYECGVPTREGATFASTTAISGERFTVYTKSDAGMNQYLNATIYQGIYNDQCFSLEAVVKGSNPDVYDPPRTAPFSAEDAMKRLNALVLNFKFTR